MKLIIDITEEDYNNIEPFLNGQTIKGGFNLFKALEIIKNGIPHETVTEFADRCRECGRERVLDKIRAEISDFEEEVFQRPNTDYSDYAAVRHCLEIIDKYRNEVSE